MRNTMVIIRSSHEEIQCVMKRSMEEAWNEEELSHTKKQEIEYHFLQELKCVEFKESLCDLGHQTNTEDQVSNFLCCCLILRNDPNVARNLKYMLATCMGK